MRMSACFVVVLILLFPACTCACLWDSDTLEQERYQFPDAHELIVGDFVRHSDAYYRWRIADRLAKPTDERTPMDYDDIAVAYDKLGQQDKAIETIYEKIRRFSSESVYESEANLGTFLIHAGHLEEGLVHIDKAIEINPDAHFGREIYQKLLVQYILQQRATNNITLPLAASDDQNFVTFLEDRLGWAEKDRPEETQKAITGVLGMMRFGHYDSPILLEALGDLLMAQGDDANMLAAQAYLRATVLASDQEGAAAAYYAKAEKAMELQHNMSLQMLQKELSVAVKQADEKFAQIEADEIAWSAAGEDLDRKFGSKYYEQPLLRTATLGVISIWQRVAHYAGMIVTIVVILACLWGMYRWLKADLAEAAANPPKA